MNKKVIDISYCQPKVDYSKLKAAGIDAVLIRTGYFGKTDTMFKTHIEGCIAAGLNIGVYTYIMSNNATQAVTEAQETIKRLEPYKGHVNYPVFCDMEDEKKYIQNTGFTRQTRTEIIKAFCNTVASAGYYPGLYINPSWLETYTVKSELLGKYDIWLASWTHDPNKPTKYNYNQQIWQWGTDKVSGIPDKVDADICYVDYPQKILSAGKNFLTKAKTYTVTANKTVPQAQLSTTLSQLKAMGFTCTSKEAN